MKHMDLRQRRNQNRGYSISLDFTGFHYKKGDEKRKGERKLRFLLICILNVSPVFINKEFNIIFYIKVLSH